MKKLFYKSKFLLVRLLVEILTVPNSIITRFHSQKKRAIILRNDFLGDFLISLPALKHLSNYFHRNKTEVCIITSNSMAKFAESTGYFDKVMTADINRLRNSLFTRIQKYVMVRKYHANYFISLLIFSRYGENDNIAFFSGAKEKFGFDVQWQTPDLLQYSCLRGLRFYNHTVVSRQGMSVFESEQAMCENIIGTKCPVVFDLSFLPRTVMEKKFEERPYYVVVPGASIQRKRWPAKRFAEVIDFIADRHPEYITVFCGIESEKKLAEEIMSYCKRQTHFLDLCGKTEIPDLFPLLKKSLFTLTNDTGQSHAAALLKVKTFCLVPLSHFRAYHPVKEYPTVRCIYPNLKDFPEYSCIYCTRMNESADGLFPCFSAISTEQVIRELQDNI